MLFYMMLTIDEGIEADLIVKIVRLPPPLPPLDPPLLGTTHLMVFTLVLHRQLAPGGQGGREGERKGMGLNRGGSRP